MYFEDLQNGAVLDIPPVVIEKKQMLDFARLYDPVPLHLDEEYAKSTRFGRLIAPGVMSFMAVWAKYLENDLFGEELVAGKSTKIEWYKPVFADDTLTGKVRITSLQRRNPYNGLAELTFEVFNQNGELVLTDVTEAIVRCRNTDCDPASN